MTSALASAATIQGIVAALDAWLFKIRTEKLAELPNSNRAIVARLLDLSGLFRAGRMDRTTRLPAAMVGRGWPLEVVTKAHDRAATLD